MSFKTLSAIVRGKFLIDPGYAMDHIPFVQSILLGTRQIEAEDKRAEITINAADLVPDDDEDDDFLAVDDDQEIVGTVGIMEITGPIMHYGGMCSYGSEEFAETIQQMDANEEISAIVLKIDSPGGQVDGTQTLVNAIKSAKKPVLGFVNDGGAASAAFWILSACDESYCSLPTDQVGSCGVMCSMNDYSKFLAKNGIKQIVVYAPQSTKKNKIYRDAIAGDTTGLSNELKFICEAFINGVSENRGDKLTSDAWKDGEMFFAQDAADMGLIDGIRSFNQVILRAAKLSAQPKTGEQTPTYQRSGQKQATQKNQNMSLFSKKFTKLSALTGKKAAEITDEEIVAVNEELTAEGLEDVVVITSAHYSEASANADANANTLAAINKVLGAGNEKATLPEAFTAFAASAKVTAESRDEWKKKAETYGAQPGATPTAPVTEEASQGNELNAVPLTSYEEKMKQKQAQSNPQA